MPLTGFAETKNSNCFNGTFSISNIILHCFAEFILPPPQKGLKCFKFCNSTAVHTFTLLKRNVKDMAQTTSENSHHI